MNGFQVAPAEVEAVLHGHPRCSTARSSAFPTARAGEVPVAAVQIDPDQPVTAGELTELVADSLATYKHLRHVVVVDAIPRLPSGKVLRRTLRDEWATSADAPTARQGVNGDRRGHDLMDVRLSSEQRGAPRRRRAGGRPTRPASGRPTRRRRAGRQARRRGRRFGLARAAHRDRRRNAAGPRASRSPSWPRSWDAASPTPPSWARRSPPTCADAPAPRRPPWPRRSCSTPGWRRWRSPTAAFASGAMVIDGRASGPPSAPVPAAAGHELGPGAVDPPTPTTDLTRPRPGSADGSDVVPSGTDPRLDRRRPGGLDRTRPRRHVRRPGRDR